MMDIRQEEAIREFNEEERSDIEGKNNVNNDKPDKIVK